MHSERIGPIHKARHQLSRQLLGLSALIWLAVSPLAFANQAQPPSPSADYLMHIAFHDWLSDRHDASQEVTRSIHLPPAMAPNESADSKVAIRPAFATMVDRSRVLLVTSGYFLTREAAGDECLDLVGAYFFTRTKTGWVLSTSNPAVVLGCGTFHNAKLEDWTGHGRVLSFLIEQTYQGQSVSTAELLGLREDHLMPLIETSIASDDDGLPIDNSSDDPSEWIYCDAVFDPKYAAPKGSELMQNWACERDKGSWRFIGNSVEFVFRKTVRPTDAHGNLLPLQVSQTRAILTLQKDGKLKLVSGKLPQYGI